MTTDETATNTTAAEIDLADSRDAKTEVNTERNKHVYTLSKHHSIPLLSTITAIYITNG